MRHLCVAATLAAALPFSGLPGEFEKIAPAAKGRVGVAAQLLESGETADLHGDEHFPMHSVYKLPISMAVLQRVDRGELKLDQLVKVEPSDFVRKGMYSPVRDKYPDGTELTIAELLRYTICESVPIYVARCSSAPFIEQNAVGTCCILLRQCYGGTGNCAKKSHGVSGKPDDDGGFAALAQLESAYKGFASRGSKFAIRGSAT
jgi:hypothetical protein